MVFPNKEIVHTFKFPAYGALGHLLNRLPFLNREDVAMRKQVKEQLLIVTAWASFTNIRVLDMKVKMFLIMAWGQIHPQLQN